MIDQASTAAFVAAPARVPKADWRTLYARRLVFTDVLALVWVVFGTQIAWFGLDSANVATKAITASFAVSGIAGHASTSASRRGSPQAGIGLG